MFRLKNGLGLDAYFDQDAGELNGNTIWYIDEIKDEFWNHERVPQFMFFCGPETHEGFLSEKFTIYNALDAELPDYIWPDTETNRFIFYRKDAEEAEKKSLTFEEGVAIVAAHLKKLNIEHRNQ